MAKRWSKGTVSILVLLALAGILLYILPGFLLSNPAVTGRVETALQRSLAKNGLTINIGSLRWSGWSRLTGESVALNDAENGEPLLQADQVRLRFSLLALAFHHKNPEACLQRIELFGPRFKLSRNYEGIWNWQRYTRKSARILQLETVVLLRDGRVEYQDSQFGYHQLHKVAGRIDLRNYPYVEWNINGSSDFGKNVAFTSRGKTRIDQRAGLGEIKMFNTPLAKAGEFIPLSYPGRIRSGEADTQLRFAWRARRFWLENGWIKTTTAAVIEVGNPLRRIVVRNLNAEFSTESIHIKELALEYGAGQLHASGNLDLSTRAIDGEIDATRVDLREVNLLFPNFQKWNSSGRADIHLNVSGTYKEPRFEGDISLSNAGISWQGDAVTEINGRAKIHQNHLIIERLTANCLGAQVNISGRIHNLLRPTLDLKIGIHASRPDPEFIARLHQPDLIITGPTAFDGNLSGTIKNPKISGRLAAEMVSYQDVQFNHPEVTLTWDIRENRLDLKGLEAGLWGGRLQAAGNLWLFPKAVRWALTGTIDGLDMKRTRFGQNMGIQGTINAETALKGEWQKGTSFEIGMVFGSFHGERLQYRDSHIDSADGIFRIANEGLNVESLRIQSGSGQLFGGFAWSRQELSADLTAVSLQLRPILPDVKRYPLDGVFNGAITLAGPAKELRGRIDGVFSEVSWAGRSIGVVRGELEIAGSKLQIINLNLETDAGTFKAYGGMLWAEEPVLDLKISGEAIQLAGFVKWLPVSPNLTLKGTGTVELKIYGKASNPALLGKLVLTTPQFGRVSMEEATIEFSGNMKEIQLTQLRMRRQATIIEATGTLNREKLDLQLTGRSFQLESLGLRYRDNSLQGTIDFKGNLSGKPSEPQLNIVVDGREVSFGVIRFQRLKGAVDWSGKTLRVSEMQLFRDDTVLNAQGEIYFTPKPMLNLNVQVLSMSIRELLQIVKVKKPGIEGRLSGNAAVTGSFDDPQIDANGEIFQAMIGSVPVNGSFHVRYKQHQTIIQSLRIQHTGGAGVVTGYGQFEPGRVFKGEVQLRDFPIQAINSFTGKELKLAGLITGNLSLEWGAQEARGNYQIEVRDMLLPGAPIGQVSIKGNFANQGLNIEDGVVQSKDGSLFIKGFMPWPSEWLQRLKFPVSATQDSLKYDLTLVFKKSPAEWSNVFAFRYRVNGGSLEGRLHVQGPFREPELYGRIDLEKVRVKLENLPLEIEGFQGTIMATNKELTLRRGRGSYGQGKFTLNGNAKLNNYRLKDFDIGLIANRVYYKNYFIDGYFDLNCQLSGSPTDSLLSGDIYAYNCKTGLLSNLPPRVIPRWNPRVNVLVRSGPNLRFTQPGLADVTIRGELRISNTWIDPVFTGEAEAVSGVISIYGQSFKIDRGKATFENCHGIQPFLEIYSRLKLSKTEIRMVLRGRMGGDISLNLSSQPYLPEADIYSMLNWSELAGNQPFTPESMAPGNISYLTDTIFGDIMNDIRRSFDVDYLYLEYDYAKNGIRLNMGDFITEQLYISYTYSFVDEMDEKWSIDYYFTPFLSMGRSYSTLDGYAWNLIYRITF